MTLQSSVDLSSILFSGDPTPFIPTNEWQTILPGQSVPPGLWMRMDITTGSRTARLMPKDGETRDSDNDSNNIISVTSEPQRSIGVRDDEFDDTLPDEDAGNTEANFFSIYSPVFESHAKFSNRRPVPMLGSLGQSTPDSEVIAFYQFWTSFSSCRQFAPEESTIAASAVRRGLSEKQREAEKKYQFTQRQNHTIRIRRFATAAQSKDPRMIRIRREAEAIAESNAARKQAEMAALESSRQAARRASEEQAAAAIAAREKAAAKALEQEALLRSAEEASKKAQREALKKLRATFGKMCTTAGLDAVHIDYIRASLTPEQLQPILAAFSIEPQSPEGKTLFASHVSELLAAEAATKEEARKAAEAARIQREAQASSKEKSTQWSPEEIAVLSKGVTMYPSGVPLRWHKMHDFLIQNFPSSSGSRDVGEVMKRARAIEAEAAATFQAKYSKTQSPAPDIPMQEAEATTTAPAVSSSASAALPTATPSSASSPSSSSSPIIPSSVSPESASSISPASGVPSPSSSSSSTVSSVSFTLSEQALFEVGLRNIPKDAPKRWAQIAGIVGTKTKAQCRERYQFIVATIKAEKMANASA